MEEKVHEPSITQCSAEADVEEPMSFVLEADKTDNKWVSAVNEEQ